MFDRWINSPRNLSAPQSSPIPRRCYRRAQGVEEENKKKLKAEDGECVGLEIGDEINLLAVQKNIGVRLDEQKRRIEHGDSDDQRKKTEEKSLDKIGQTNKRVARTNKFHNCDLIAMDIKRHTNGVNHHDERYETEDHRQIKTHFLQSFRQT